MPTQTEIRRFSQGLQSSGLPYAERVQIARNFWDRNMVDDAYTSLPPEEQEKIFSRFGEQAAGKQSFMEKVKDFKFPSYPEAQPGDAISGAEPEALPVPPPPQAETPELFPTPPQTGVSEHDFFGMGASPGIRPQFSDEIARRFVNAPSVPLAREEKEAGQQIRTKVEEGRKADDEFLATYGIRPDSPHAVSRGAYSALKTFDQNVLGGLGKVVGGDLYEPDREDVATQLGAGVGGLGAFLADLALMKRTATGQLAMGAAGDAAKVLGAGPKVAAIAGEAGSLGIGGAMHSMSEAVNAKDPGMVAESLLDNAAFGAAFGGLRVAFPADKLKRIVAGIVALDVVRSAQEGRLVGPLDDRTIAEKTANYLMDVAFLWQNAPPEITRQAKLPEQIKYLTGKVSEEIGTDFTLGQRKALESPVDPMRGDGWTRSEGVAPQVRHQVGLPPGEVRPALESPRDPARGDTFIMRPRGVEDLNKRFDWDMKELQKGLGEQDAAIAETKRVLAESEFMPKQPVEQGTPQAPVLKAKEMEGFLRKPKPEGEVPEHGWLEGDKVLWAKPDGSVATGKVRRSQGQYTFIDRDGGGTSRVRSADLNLAGETAKRKQMVLLDDMISTLEESSSRSTTKLPDETIPIASERPRWFQESSLKEVSPAVKALSAVRSGQATKHQSMLAEELMRRAAPEYEQAYGVDLGMGPFSTARELLAKKKARGELPELSPYDDHTARRLVNSWLGNEDMASFNSVRGFLKDKEQIARAVGSVYKNPVRLTRFAARGEGKDSIKADFADAGLWFAAGIRESSARGRNGFQEARDTAAALREKGGAKNLDLAKQIDYGLEIAGGKHKELGKILHRISGELQSEGRAAMDAGLIGNVLEAYAPRYWELEGKGGQPKFSKTTGHAKRRSYETIFDGINAGMKPRIRGLAASRAELRREMAKTQADKDFVFEGSSATDAEGRPFFTTNAKKAKEWGWEKINHPGFSSFVPVRSYKLPLKEAAEYGGDWGFKRGVPQGLDYIESVDAAAGARLRKYMEANEVATGKDVFVTLNDGRLSVYERVPIHAPKEWAEYLNTVLAPLNPDLATPMLEGLYKAETAGKQMLFAGSRFHDVALSLSWWFGARKHAFSKEGATALEAVVPSQAAKTGYQDAMEASPVIVRGVKNGLTGFSTPEWDSSLAGGQRNLSGGGRSAAIGKWRERATNELFQRFQTGLKFRTFAVEYANAVKRATVKKGSVLTESELDTIAQQKAAYINADYGGLHTKRLGKSETGKRLSRFFMLAPDWTESNLRYIPGAEPIISAIGKRAFPGLFGTGKMLPKGMQGEYARFYSHALAYAAITTILADAMVNGWDETYKRFGTAIDKFGNKAARDGAWSARGELLDVPAFNVDLTKVWDELGIEHQGERVIWRLPTQFEDPVRLALESEKYLKGKASLTTGAVADLVTKTDWGGKPYLNWREMIEYSASTEKLRLTQPYKSTDTESFPTYLPAWIADQMMSPVPIPAQQMIRYAMGETDGLSAIAKGLGLRISEKYPQRPQRPKRPYRFMD